MKYFLKFDSLISNAKYLLRLIARAGHNTREEEKYESFIIIILVSPLLPVMSIEFHMCKRKKREKKVNSIKATAMTICDLHTQALGGEMCEMEVKQFTICRRLISQIDLDDFTLHCFCSYLSVLHLSICEAVKETE